MSAITHEALFYDSADSFAHAIVPFLREGIEADEGLIVATTPARADLIRDGLGADAGRVVFADAAQVYRTPVSAIAAYDAVLKNFAEHGRTAVRAVGEVQYGTDRQERWLPYEPAAHNAFLNHPLWVICPYDTSTLPSWIIEHAKRTHPILRDPHPAPSSLFARPEETIGDAVPVRLRPGGPPVAQVAVSGTLHHLRAMLSSNIADENVATDHILTAVNEIATNAIRHGSGRAYVSLWIVDGGVVCDVLDTGGGLDDLFAGYRPPANPAAGGMGLWIARGLADEFTIMPGRGLTIRLGFFSEDRNA